MGEKGIEKVTWLKLEAKNLESHKVYKKVKKAINGISQIRDQLFDEKSNTVTVKVVCCSPEEIMDILCNKGKGAIQVISIIDTPKPNQPEKPKDIEKALEKPKEAENQPKPAPMNPPPVNPSSQPMMYGYNPVSTTGHPVASYDDHYGWATYNNYGGSRPPPPWPYNNDYYRDDYNQSSNCNIL